MAEDHVRVDLTLRLFIALTSRVKLEGNYLPDDQGWRSLVGDHPALRTAHRQGS
jgi:hypothetical protein